MKHLSPEGFNEILKTAVVLSSTAEGPGVHALPTGIVREAVEFALRNEPGIKLTEIFRRIRQFIREEGITDQDVLNALMLDFNVISQSLELNISDTQAENDIAIYTTFAVNNDKEVTAADILQQTFRRPDPMQPDNSYETLESLKTVAKQLLTEKPGTLGVLDIFKMIAQEATIHGVDITSHIQNILDIIQAVIESHVEEPITPERIQIEMNTSALGYVSEARDNLYSDFESLVDKGFITEEDLVLMVERALLEGVRTKELPFIAPRFDESDHKRENAQREIFTLASIMLKDGLENPTVLLEARCWHLVEQEVLTEKELAELIAIGIEQAKRELHAS